jgi:hypothetical protein
LDFLELFLERKICGLGPQGCGPRRPSQPWTDGHYHVPELIEARPPAALVAGVAGRGPEEGKGGHGGPGSGLTRAQKAVEQRRIGGEGDGGESFGADCSGLRNGARRSVGGGDVGVPFYRVGGGAGRPGIGGEQAVVVVRHNGGGGYRFGRGSTGVVVGSDEGSALVVMGAEGEPGDGARMRGGGGGGRSNEEDDRAGPACWREGVTGWLGRSG